MIRPDDGPVNREPGQPQCEPAGAAINLAQRAAVQYLCGANMRPWDDGLHVDRSAHPDAPAGGSGAGSSRCPGPLGLATAADVPVHPDAPAARLQIWDPRNTFTSSSESQPGLALVAESVEALLGKHVTRLRDAIPDPLLQSAYEVHIDAAASRDRRARARGSRLHESFLRRLHVSTSWIDEEFFGFANDHSLQVGSALSRSSTDEPLQDAEFLRQFTAIAAHRFESAHARLARRWAEASAAGSRALSNLLAEWTRRLEHPTYARQTGIGQEEAAQTSRPVRSSSHVTPVKTWVEIRLVDDRGNPVPNVAYHVVLPDGSRRTGRLGADATVTFTDIDPGQCQVRFPELDGREWSAA